MPKNPGTIAALEDELKYWHSEVSKPTNSKHNKQAALNMMQKIERELGLTSQPYNSGSF